MDDGRPGTGTCQAFEVEVTSSATSALIDAVHEVSQRPPRGAGRWRDGNVVDMDIPTITDCTIREAHRATVRPPRRPIAAISIRTRRNVQVDVVFATDDRRSWAVFIPATSGGADERASALADHLASSTCAALTATGEPAQCHAHLRA